VVDRDIARVLLKQGDALLKFEDYDGALRAYEQVARGYADDDFALKAVAVWKQIVEIIAKHAPEQRALYEEARASLIPLYRKLGLEDDALRLECEGKRVLH
jgi:hypothetical protein